MTDPEEKRTSMTCPRCGCRHLLMANIRRTAKRIVWTRECRYCGRRIVTSEPLPECNTMSGRR